MHVMRQCKNYGALPSRTSSDYNHYPEGDTHSLSKRASESLYRVQPVWQDGCAYAAVRHGVVMSVVVRDIHVFRGVQGRVRHGNRDRELQGAQLRGRQWWNMALARPCTPVKAGSHAGQSAGRRRRWRRSLDIGVGRWEIQGSKGLCSK